MNAAQAKLVRAGLAGCYADQGTLAGACQQAADELDVLSQAINNGATYVITGTTLEGITERLRMAAELASAIDGALQRGGQEQVQP